jgi:hypothetical protein
MTPMRTRYFALATALAAATPVMAAESWDCMLNVPGPPAVQRPITVQIDGGTLNWFTDAPAVGPDGKNIPRMPNGHTVGPMPYFVLEDSSTDVTAVSRVAPNKDYKDSSSRLLPEAGVLLIRKTDGRLRVAKISFDGNKTADGHCTLASKPKAP